MPLKLELPNNLSWFPFILDDYDFRIKQDMHTYYVIPNVVVSQHDTRVAAKLIVYRAKTFYWMPKPAFVHNVSDARDAVHEANKAVDKKYRIRSPDKTLLNSMYATDVSCLGTVHGTLLVCCTFAHAVPA